VSWYSDVFDIVFPDLDRDRANNLWKKDLAKSTTRKSKKGEQDPSEREVDEKEFDQDDEEEIR
jgi:ATP-dependent Lon protease